MSRIIVTILAVSLFFFSSCIDMLEEVFLEKDGSGKYILTFDMSSLFEDEFSKGMFDQMLQEQGGEGLTMQGMEMDSMIYFKDLPAAEKKKVDDPKFWEKMSMRIQMSETKKLMVTTLTFNFDEVSEIEKFHENMGKLDEAANLGGMAGPDKGLMPAGAAFQLKKGLLTRMASKSNTQLFKGEEMEFAKMFFAKARYKTVYHLPGKVKKTTIENATIDGKTVTVDRPFLDVIEGKAAVQGDIKFKKK